MVRGSAENRPIESFTGGAVLFRSNFLKNTGGFDESYFLYYEDVDLARRGADWGGSTGVYRQAACGTGSAPRRPNSATGPAGCRSATDCGSRFALAMSPWWRAVWLSIRRLRWSPRGAHAKALVTGIWRCPSARLAAGPLSAEREPDQAPLSIRLAPGSAIVSEESG